MKVQLDKGLILEDFNSMVQNGKQWFNQNIAGKTKENGYNEQGVYNKENDVGYQKFLNGPSSNDRDINGEQIASNQFNESTYDEGVKAKLDKLGLGIQEDRKSPETEVNKVVKAVDKDESSQETEYFKTIYDNKELAELENPKENKDLKEPKGHLEKK